MSSDAELSGALSSLNIGSSDASNNEVNKEATGDVCANCGKESSDINNTCNKCKAVKYCNAACKKKHRSKHKAECERIVKRAAEIQAEAERLEAERHDIQLFKQPPPLEDCPICMLPLPTLLSGSKYEPCCGKTICSGCSYSVDIRALVENVRREMRNDDKQQQKCAFCRTPTHTSEEEGIDRVKKRVEVNDPEAMVWLGNHYASGTLPNYAKALELFHRAAELGNARAYLSIGAAYCKGAGVERNVQKANYYNQEAAMRGEIRARYSLGATERNAGNFDRALKHYMIAVR